MGAVFIGVYLLTGSLVAPIVLHATVDLANGLMAYRALQRTETAASSSPDLRGGHHRPDVRGLKKGARLESEAVERHRATPRHVNAYPFSE